MQNGKVGTQELGAVAAAPARSAGAPRVGRIIWEFWKAYAERIAFYQTTVILSLIYLIVVGPIWVVGRLTGHQFLPLLPRTAASFWHPVQMGREASVDNLKKQG